MGGTLRSQGHGAVSRPFPICFLAVTFIFRSHRPYNGRVTLDEAMAALEAAGTAQARKIYRRHGLAEPLLGVSYADLGKLKKQVRRDQQLAQGLWDTRVHDAQVLATMVADPAAFDRGRAGQWAGTAVDYAVADAFAKDVVIRTPWATGLADEWVAAPGELLRRAGWATVGCCATFGDASIPDAWFEHLLPAIERHIHQSPDRVKEAMNSALIAIGSRNPALRGPAIAAAGRIGKVAVDHGETSCKTPDAIGYIEKTHARRALTAR